MADRILLTRVGCIACDEIKAMINGGVSVFDNTTLEGITEAAYYSQIDMPVPILIIDEDTTRLSSYREIIYDMETIKTRLSG